MKRVVALLPVEDFWRPLLFAICGIVLLIGLLTFRLNKLTPGFAESELVQRNSSQSIKSITSNPLHIWQKSNQFTLQQLGRKGPAAMRLPSVMIGFMTILCMFIILKNWYTARVAVLGTLLFATSSWFLHTTRLATGEINYLLPLLLITAGVWLYNDRFSTAASVILTITGLLMLYTPGLIWLILLLIIWQRRVFKKIRSNISKSWQIGIGLLFIIGLVPLCWSFIQQPMLIREWLGLPAAWPNSFVVYLKNIGKVPLELFVRGPGNPMYGIGRLPLVDIVTTAMVILGSFVSITRLGLDRTRLLIGSTIVSVLFIALKGPVSISFLLPIIYLIAAAGIALLLQQWFTVFPRNPFARTVGATLVSVLVLLSCYYNLSHYYIAWPNVPETMTTFQHQP